MKLTLHMKKIISHSLIALLFLSSCNKDISAPVPNTFPTPTGQSIGELINTDANYTLLKHALTRAGLLAAVTSKNTVFTLFAPDNAAFTASGIASTAVIDALPIATLTSILNYHIIPGIKVMSTNIPTTFPNVQMPTGFIFPAPNTSPLARFSIFPSKRGSTVWVNNIPVVTPDIAVANGVMHKVAVIVAPPTRLLLDTIKSDPDLDYFEAALVRADSGLSTTAAPSFQYYLGNSSIAPGANFTVFAPNNAAFQSTLTGAITLGLINMGVSPANAAAQAAAWASTTDVFSNPALYPVLTAQVVRGIVAYHLMPLRAFAVNFSSTATNYPTFVNGSLPTHPGVAVSSTITGGFATGLSVKGVGNASAATAVATAAGVDRIAVNGVFYKINQVLLPQ